MMSTLQRIPVTAPTGDYTIAFGPGALDHAGELLREAGLAGRVAVVSSEPVRSLHAPRLIESLNAAGFTAVPVEAPDGEAAKNVEELARLWSAFRAGGLDRRSAVLALGGGVTGDLAGFAAATYMRGVPFVQVPTTLLAQVDASIGGKTGIDHDGVKNLAGAFHNARLVITDPEALATLPDGERRSGLAEVIKHAVIASPEQFSRLERELAESALPAPATLADSLRVKVGVVGRDPYERGERAILNFGHTFGHGVEAVSDYRLPHGYAVAIGMVAAARTAQRAGLATPDLAPRLEALIRLAGLPTACPELRLDPAAVRAAMSSDKKAQAGRLRLVLIRQIGEPVVTSDIPEPLVQQAIAEMLGE